MAHPGLSSIQEIAKMSGVADIKPTLAKAKFVSALRAEAAGDHAGADGKLAEAIAAIDASV